MQDEARRITIRYLRIDSFGHLFMSLSLVGAAALRGSGDMRTPMFVLVAVNVLNAAASYALVFGIGVIPAVGVDGIAYGTLIARISGGALMVLVLAMGTSGLHIRAAQMKLRSQATGRILHVGWPAAVDGLIMWIGHFLFLMLIARLAEQSLSKAYYAAHIIAIRMEAFTYLPAFAWGTASATLVGQALGAGKIERARRTGHLATLQCCSLALFTSAVFYFGAGRIYSLMHEDAMVQSVGVPAFQILAWFQPFMAASGVYIASLRGAGDTRFPLIVTILGIVAVRLPVGFLCGYWLQGGLLGAWMGMFGDMILRAVLGAGRYLQGGWIVALRESK